MSGFWNYISDVRRERRDDRAIRRYLRAAAHALAEDVIMARKFGFANAELLTSNLSYLTEMLKDREVDTALSDRASAAIHEAVRLCNIFVKSSANLRIDPKVLLKEADPAERERKQTLYSAASKATFDKLREYFREDSSPEIVAKFDEAEVQKDLLDRTRHGLP